VELNASKRARQLLTDAGLVYSEEEKQGVSSMLNAAAFTYVAGLATAVMQVLYFGSMVAGLGGRRRS
jgi:Zn-dependent membrane protease YugP